MLFNKMIKNLFVFLCLLQLCASAQIKAQETVPSTKNATAQPTIMVVPFARQNESLRNVYEYNEEARIAVTKAKEAFDKRGVNTIDLVAKLKQTNNSAVLQEGQASDMKDEVIALSGADIYVVVEASKNYSSTGNSVNVILTAYDAFSGESLANKTGNSPKIYTDNFEKLVEKAVEVELDNLLNTIQEKFTIMREKGRTVVVTIGIAEGATLAFNAEFGADGDLLSDQIEDWMEKNAYKGQYHLQGATKNKMIFDLVKIPVFDEAGNSYRVRSFTTALRKYLRSLQLEAEQTTQGNNIIFTLSQK
jgi:hypothetical protein